MVQSGTDSIKKLMFEHFLNIFDKKLNLMQPKGLLPDSTVIREYLFNVLKAPITTDLTILAAKHFSLIFKFLEVSENQKLEIEKCLIEKSQDA